MNYLYGVSSNIGYPLCYNKAKADAIREAIKEKMVQQNTAELVAGAYIVRFTNVISNRFDSTTFKRVRVGRDGPFRVG